MPIPKKIRARFAKKEFAHAYMDQVLNARIATQLKVLREQRDYTQKELADLSGMKQERISVLENVSYSSWSLNTLRKLASALDVIVRVSFETFGSGVADIEDITRAGLERMSREEEINLDNKIETALVTWPPILGHQMDGPVTDQPSGLNDPPPGQYWSDQHTPQDDTRSHIRH